MVGQKYFSWIMEFLFRVDFGVNTGGWLLHIEKYLQKNSQQTPNRIFKAGQNIYQQFPTRECSLYFTKINVINVNRYNTGQSLIEHPAQQHSVKTEIRFCADTQRPLRKNEYCSHENV